MARVVAGSSADVVLTTRRSADGGSKAFVHRSKAFVHFSAPISAFSAAVKSGEISYHLVTLEHFSSVQ
jgi:hypothetical protein